MIYNFPLSLLLQDVGPIPNIKYVGTDLPSLSQGFLNTLEAMVSHQYKAIENAYLMVFGEVHDKPPVHNTCPNLTPSLDRGIITGPFCSE